MPQGINKLHLRFFSREKENKPSDIFWINLKSVYEGGVELGLGWSYGA